MANYRQQSLQHPRGELRVTLDLELSFYAPPADLWTRTQALVRGTFGAPRAVDRVCLVEVKQRTAMPAWLERALYAAGGQPTPFSKFLRPGQAVYGRL